MYGTLLNLVDGVSVFPDTLMGMSGQWCGEVIETRRHAVSMCHLRKVTFIPGSPGRAITEMHPPGGLCAREGVLLGGGSHHRALPAVGHRRLGHQDEVDTESAVAETTSVRWQERRVEWLHIPVPLDGTVL